MTPSSISSSRASALEILRNSPLQSAGVAWVLGSTFFFASQFVERRTSLPSGIASTIQVIGVAALIAWVLGAVGGLLALATILSRHGDPFGSIIIRSAAAGIVLLPFFVGGFLLFPALLTLIVRGHLDGVDVRLPAAAVLAGLATAGWTAGWPGGIEGPIPLNILLLLGAGAEGAAWIWFGKTMDGVAPPVAPLPEIG